MKTKLRIAWPDILFASVIIWLFLWLAVMQPMKRELEVKKVRSQAIAIEALYKNRYQTTIAIPSQNLTEDGLKAGIFDNIEGIAAVKAEGKVLNSYGGAVRVLGENNKFVIEFAGLPEYVCKGAPEVRCVAS